MPRWLRIVADLVFPASCEVCDRPLSLGVAASLCTTCRATIHPPRSPLCVHCGVPIGTSLSPCRDCRSRAPAFATARAAGLYLPAAGGLNPLAVAIHRLKYDGRRPVADELGSILAIYYPFTADAVLVPVPLHPARLRHRGFNQAVLLARALARRRGLSVAARALLRVRPTVAQPGLGAGARRTNLEGAFVAVQPTQVTDRCVVLVDDVLTTGATADACARALRVAGAARVDVYTVGRAP